MTTAQDGGKVVSLTHRPPLPQEIYLVLTSVKRLSRSQVHSATGRIISMKNSNDTIGNRTRDLPVCSGSALTTTPPRAPIIIVIIIIINSEVFLKISMSTAYICNQIATSKCPSEATMYCTFAEMDQCKIYVWKPQLEVGMPNFQQTFH